jgi:hypothetical protein
MRGLDWRIQAEKTWVKQCIDIIRMEQLIAVE